MPSVLDVQFRPPLAVARLGGSATPLENFEWRDDPTIHGAARTVVEPTVTLEIGPDGAALPYRPLLLKFRDGELLRPVAPFFELWARIAYGANDPEVAAGTAKAGEPLLVPLTSALLQRAGGSPAGILYTVHVANRKAARRTGDTANSFEAFVQVAGDDYRRRELLGLTLPRPNQEPLVLPERPIPLGWFQAVRAVPSTSIDVDLDVLRVRFTPGRGEVYGPPGAIEARDDATGRVFRIVPPANRILNEKASWLRYDASSARFQNPEPADTYDGSDQDDEISWGVVDDTCDGTIQAEVVVAGRRLLAVCRVTVAPPDYAPDRRPFLSLADDLADRDLEPLSVERIRGSAPQTMAEVTDLFQRVFETAGLVNLDGNRARALDDDQGLLTDAQRRRGQLPFTDERSMTGEDRPYASVRVDALIPAPDAAEPLPYSKLVPLAHESLAQQDELLDFLSAHPHRVAAILRPPYGAFAELKETVASSDMPVAEHRDPRLERDLAHDMRMPPYMRDELAAALSLTRRQYLEVMRYVAVLADRGRTETAPHLSQMKEPVRREVAASVAARPQVAWWDTARDVLDMPAAKEAPDLDSPLRQRVNSVLNRIRQNAGSKSGEKSGGKPGGKP